MTVMEPLTAWILNQGQKRFSLLRAVAATGLPRKPVLRVLDRFVAEGYLEELSDTPVPPAQGEWGPQRQNPVFRAASVQPLAARPKRAVPGRMLLRDKMWKVIRMRRRLTRTDLQILAGVSRSSTEDYTKLLEREGYLRRAGKEGREILWLLVQGLDQVTRPRTADEPTERAP